MHSVLCVILQKPCEVERDLPNQQRRGDQGCGLSSAWILSPGALLAWTALCHLTVSPISLLFQQILNICL